ncbi:hypothetical protein HMPREF9069_00727 [Atopobium sp. oral taxon 810 str. F0209]|nr:hypothetical protein HMPREF9069_00727 [Atopobium sp. oral taxon 810 str. F0209]
MKISASSDAKTSSVSYHMLKYRCGLYTPQIVAISGCNVFP